MDTLLDTDRPVLTADVESLGVGVRLGPLYADL